MTTINLLPWRETQRRARKKRTFKVCISSLAISVVLAVLGFIYIDQGLQGQHGRNAYLRSEITALTKAVREVKVLIDQRDQLLARLQVIQVLQTNRLQTVHLFDELVNKLPQGVYFDRIQKSTNGLKIDGKAQSNGQISVLMRNLDSSQWVGKTVLMTVDVVEQEALLVSKFSLQANQ